MKLFIDSSTNYLYLALLSENVNSAFVRLGKNDHSETMVDFINQFLKDNCVFPQQVDSIYVGRGPGSYTGIRLAGTIAKVFACITNISLYSFSSLDLLLASHRFDEGLFLARIWAKRDHSYYKAIEYYKDSSSRLIQNDTYSEDSILEKYKDYKELLPEDIYPQASFQLAKNILDNHLYKKEDYFTYVPNYMRESING